MKTRNRENRNQQGVAAEEITQGTPLHILYLTDKASVSEEI